jgi:hypothetical protein
MTPDAGGLLSAAIAAAKINTGAIRRMSRLAFMPFFNVVWRELKVF